MKVVYTACALNLLKRQYSIAEAAIKQYVLKIC